jgi:heptaprenyl diphosphate synthase
MIVKVLLSGLTFGGVNAMMYSLAGGVLSMAAMLLVRRIPGTGILGVSVSGAAMHNVGQVAMAMLILHTPKLVYYMAVLVAIGVVTGVLTGVVAQSVLRIRACRPEPGDG